MIGNGVQAKAIGNYNGSTLETYDSLNNWKYKYITVKEYIYKSKESTLILVFSYKLKVFFRNPISTWT